MVKVEFFTVEPFCAGCVALLRLADELAEKYGDHVKVIKHVETIQGIR